jgi:CHAT domain
MPHRLLPPLLASLALLMTVSAHAASPQIVLEQSRAHKEAIIEGARRTGEVERARLDAAEAMLRKAIDDPESAAAAPELLFELGSVIRLGFRFTDAIPILEKAAAAAEAAGHRDLAFDAWLDVARSHFLGTYDHGSASAAFERALLVAGDRPTDRQRFRIASYRTELLSTRNDIEAGFAAAAEAIRTAQTPEDRFYAHYDVAGLFTRVAASCDYVPSFDDCRRAVNAAKLEYSMAARIARAAGWTALAALAEDTASGLQGRGLIIDHWEDMEKMVARPEMFAPRVATDVLVNSRFGTDPSALAEIEDLQKAIEAMAQAGNVYGLAPQRDARSLFLAGLAVDLRGDQERASQLYLAAVQRLEEERGSLLDPRRRGTMIEDRAEFYSRAALRLLDLGRPEPAFEILERARARGLAELIGLGERGDLGPAELSFLSELLHLEAMASRSQKALKDRALQDGTLDANDPSLDELSNFENDRLALLRRHPQILKKLAGSAWSPVRLPELQAKAAIAGTSVLLYWIQRDGLVVWHVGPGGSMVRAVFLPQVILREKVERLRRSAERSSETFDAMMARELYLYLIAPMKPKLSTEHLMIVPHGELLGLPFETLINPDTGRYLIEEAEVVYAPNASG